jgi:hypothetical protein
MGNPSPVQTQEFKAHQFKRSDNTIYSELYSQPISVKLTFEQLEYLCRLKEGGVIRDRASYVRSLIQADMAAKGKS